MISFECPHCNVTIRVKDKYAGIQGKCSFCGKRVTCPGIVPIEETDESRSFIPEDNKFSNSHARTQSYVKYGESRGGSVTGFLYAKRWNLLLPSIRINGFQALVAIIGFVLLSGLAYLYWARTPTYSLRQVRNAIQTHDFVKFEKYVDIDGLSARLIDDATSYALTKEPEQSALDGLANALGSGLVQLMKPRLTEEIREQVRRMVESGSRYSEFENASEHSRTRGSPETWDRGSGLQPESSQVKFGSSTTTTTPESEDVNLKSLAESFITRANEYKGIRYVRKEGKIAFVGLGFYDAKLDADLTVELKLRHMSGYWQVAELANVSELLREIDTLETTRLAELNAPIREEISQTLKLEKASKSTREDDFGISKYVDISIIVRNVSNREVKAFSGTVSIYGSERELVRSIQVVDNDPIWPSTIGGGTWSVSVNSFDTSEMQLYELDAAQATFVLDIHQVTFDDDTRIEMQNSAEFISPDAAVKIRSANIESQEGTNESTDIPGLAIGNQYILSDFSFLLAKPDRDRSTIDDSIMLRANSVVEYLAAEVNKDGTWCKVKYWKVNEFVFGYLEAAILQSATEVAVPQEEPLVGTKWSAGGMTFSFETGGVLKINDQIPGEWSLEESDLRLRTMGEEYTAEFDGENIIYDGVPLERIR